MSSSSASVGRPRDRVHYRRLTLGAACLLFAAGLAIALLWHKRVERRLPVLFALPAFSLVDEQGQPFGSAELAGRPYVADFIYTACRDTCPLLTARMGQLQDLLQTDPDSVRLVSFTVDPEHDSPVRLADYARGARAIPRLWTFVTGPVAQVTALLEQGFKVSMEPGAPSAGPGGDAGVTGAADLNHDGHFVLVDGKGRIRGYFSPSAEGLAEIRAALKDLLLGA